MIHTESELLEAMRLEVFRWRHAGNDGRAMMEHKARAILIAAKTGSHNGCDDMNIAIAALKQPGGKEGDQGRRPMSLPLCPECKHRNDCLLCCHDRDHSRCSLFVHRPSDEEVERVARIVHRRTGSTMAVAVRTAEEILLAVEAGRTGR